jgi:hypothetical protein
MTGVRWRTAPREALDEAKEGGRSILYYFFSPT